MRRGQFTSGLIFTGALGLDPAWAAGFNESDAALAVRSALERGANTATADLERTRAILKIPR